MPYSERYLRVARQAYIQRLHTHSDRTTDNDNGTKQGRLSGAISGIVEITEQAVHGLAKLAEAKE